MILEAGREASRGVSTPALVSEIVRQFQVHYEVYPESVVLRDRSIRHVGFRLELYGRVGSDAHVRPGDDRCREVCRGLRQISSSIVAATNGGCLCDVAGTAASLYSCGGQGGAHACVRVDIRIFHGDGCERPIDPTQARALHEMEEHLGALGVSRGRST
jgi:hypothetical protein